MAGFAPFGRDDQPLLDVRIIGGKRVEIAVDQYGRPLNNNKKSKGQNTDARFSRSLSEGHNANSHSPRNTAVPPWVRGETPPKKVLRQLESPNDSTRQSSRSSSLPGSPIILPPITRNQLEHEAPKAEVIHDERDSLSEIIRAQVQGMDTNNLKDAYMEFCGLDSTLTGFVDAEQVEKAFARCRIPINGTLLQTLNSRFMSARRPNWVNYEQLLKFVNNIVKGEKKSDVVPRLDLSSNPGDLARSRLPQNSSYDRDIPLKPNEISPRSINDGSLSGRQSAIVVNRAFQDRQDVHLLVEMEKILKQVDRVRDLIWKLQETLEQNDPQSNIISSQKLKTFCLRHHLPFNGSLLDKILDRLDPRGTGRVNWESFMVFIERALPIDAITNQESTAAGSRGSIVETPPLQPTWETRKPLGAVPERSRVITETAVMEQEEMFDEQQKNLDLQLKEQSQELAEILNKQQKDLDRRQKSLHIDHISEYEQEMNRNVPLNQEELEEQHRNLVRQQMHLIEQKRKIQKEQEELDKVLQHDGEHKATYDEAESPIQRFLRLANALFLSDDDNSGFLDIDSTRRLVKNYNLVYHLDFTSDIIENAIGICSTPDRMVSIEHLLNKLKRYI